MTLLSHAVITVNNIVCIGLFSRYLGLFQKILIFVVILNGSEGPCWLGVIYKCVSDPSLPLRMTLLSHAAIAVNNSERYYTGTV